MRTDDAGASGQATNKVVRLGSGGFSSESDIRKMMTQLSRCEADLQAAVAATAAAWSHADLAPEWQAVYLRISRAQEEIQKAGRVVAAAMSRFEGCDRRRRGDDAPSSEPVGSDAKQ